MTINNMLKDLFNPRTNAYLRPSVLTGILKVNSLGFKTVGCRAIGIATVITTITACSHIDREPPAPTLADIDISQQDTAKGKSGIEKKSQQEIRKAYRTYVKNAPAHDSSRQKALTRLAQLELELSNSLLKDDRTFANQSADVTQSLNRTISLLETTLKDYPKAEGNDKVLYQLAQAYERADRYQQSIATLNDLVTRYPKSPLYTEAQFRLGESAFAQGNYITAEDAYTEVILTPGSDKFYTKSLFKRGWSRYKQQLYTEATDDYIDALTYQELGEYASLNDADKAQLDEYLRAIGLAFSYQSGAGRIGEYFAQRDEFRYLYEIHTSVSDIFLKQERFSDAATVLEEYTQANRQSLNTPKAELKIIAAWREGKFTSRLYSAIERFYKYYQPKADFWQQHNDEATYKLAYENLRTYITQVSSYFHKRYQDKNKNEDFKQASLWYKRYLEHYSAHANKDNIYSLYGELLLAAKQQQNALEYFSLAAYDGNLILDKKAAFATISISNQLFENTRDEKSKQQWLDQHLVFAERFVELYPKDSLTNNIALNASEHAFNAKRYNKVIDISNYISDSAQEKIHFNANSLKARAYLELKQFGDAEAVYLELADSRYTSRKARKDIDNSLGLAIYRQAEQAQNNKQLDLALNHFVRISRVAPKSSLAATGLYDAIALTIQNERWQQSIALSEEFKRLYPKHKRNAEVTQKLSVAYLKSDQKGKAAQEFERIAKFENNLDVKIAAQWQAAELYEAKNNIQAAIRAYRDYAHNYKKPYAQNMEAMYKLSGLYQKTGESQKRYFWQNNIRKADQKATKSSKTERTTFIASSTTLDLARQKQKEFSRTKLVEPIAKNLKRKKSAMQESVKLYGQASAYGIQDITTEATANIGDIYLDFSEALLESERPSNLSQDELEQYEILLEDQAFPFEEKAIEFYEVNLARTKDGTYDKWIQQSFDKLVTLFPVRYSRKGKIHALKP